MDTCRSSEVYPIVAAEMAALHSKIDIIANGVSENDTEAKMWDKINTCNDLVEEIIKNNPTLTERYGNSLVAYQQMHFIHNKFHLSWNRLEICSFYVLK